MFENWGNYTLRKQLLIVFAGLTFGSLVLIQLIASISIVSIVGTIKITSNEILEQQIVNNTDISITESSDLFDKTLSRAVEGFVLPYTIGTEDTYRSDYSMGFTESYFEYGDTYLAQPLTFDSRFGKDVSHLHSGYYVPGSTPASIESFSAALNATRDSSAHIDSFFKPVYRDNVAFVAGYVGFEESGIFRHYPGTGTLTTDPTRGYDPRARPWYLDAKAKPKEVIITDPYQDAAGKGWMISIARTVHNVETDTIVGVSSSDMLISTLKTNIDNVKFLTSGKATLLQTNGVVVADRDWAANNNDPTLFTYESLSTPPVTSDLWSKIRSGSGTVDYQTDNDGTPRQYLVSYKPLTGTYMQNYIMVVFVPKDEISAPIDQVSKEMDRVSEQFTWVSLTIFGIVLVVVMSSVLILTNSIVKPLSQMARDSQQITDNLGKADLFEGVFERQSTGLGEAEGLQTGFIGMIKTMQKEREEKTKGSTKNEYYQVQSPWNYSFDGENMYPSKAPQIQNPSE